jgi:Ras-related protein Rab-1A
MNELSNFGDFDYMFKLVIIGEAGVGKSALLTRYVDDSFTMSYIVTVGVDFRIKTMDVLDKKVKL